MTEPLSTSGRIIAHGRVTWTQLLLLTDGLTCAWADHQGWHAGACPDSATAYTHVWGWSRDRLLRARIDETDVVVAELVVDGTAGQDVPVRVIPRPEAEPWAASIFGEDLVVVRTETNSPIGFVAFGHAGDTWTLRAVGKMP